MARRMNRKVHVRCRTGEKVEIASKPHLLLWKDYESRKNWGVYF